ncbi:hypothetical protein [Bacillus sp. B1-b2]|uniref:hypothetical protein n=1 Tax=Bacillus sp. B1-b2 TaxID=2653201 RepID=UPI00126272A2|nr:hypothetical protein [Bacillus sp. B1-b2]KAB7672028.1 hypothetical protein F9279_03640 [Bacillus sp. B1-b2]
MKDRYQNNSILPFLILVFFSISIMVATYPLIISISNNTSYMFFPEFTDSQRYVFLVLIVMSSCLSFTSIYISFRQKLGFWKIISIITLLLSTFYYPTQFIYSF